MKKLILLAVLIAIFAFYKQGHKSSDSAENNNTSAENIDVGHGFVKVFMPDGSNPNVALVLTPIHCTSEEVAMGKKLEEDLKAAGVPVSRAENFDISVDNATEDQKIAINQSVELFKSDSPIVFLNGYGKSRPTVAEVLEVYKLTK